MEGANRDCQSDSQVPGSPSVVSAPNSGEASQLPDSPTSKEEATAPNAEEVGTVANAKEVGSNLCSKGHSQELTGDESAPNSVAAAGAKEDGDVQVKKFLLSSALDNEADLGQAKWELADVRSDASLHTSAGEDPSKRVPSEYYIGTPANQSKPRLEARQPDEEQSLNRMMHPDRDSASNSETVETGKEHANGFLLPSALSKTANESAAKEEDDGYLSLVRLDRRSVIFASNNSTNAEEGSPASSALVESIDSPSSSRTVEGQARHLGLQHDDTEQDVDEAALACAGRQASFASMFGWLSQPSRQNAPSVLEEDEEDEDHDLDIESVVRGVVTLFTSWEDDADRDALCSALGTSLARAVVPPDGVGLRVSARLLHPVLKVRDPKDDAMERIDIAFILRAEDPNDIDIARVALQLEASFGGGRRLLPCLAETLMDTSKPIPRKLRICMEGVNY